MIIIMILDPGEGLVHKFEELEDDGLQKLPARRCAVLAPPTLSLDSGI